MTELERAQQRIGELEDVCALAYEALVFLHQFLTALILQAESPRAFIICDSDWFYEAQSRAEQAMAMTKHRRI